MKRRNVQSSALRPSFPLQAETAVDVGSITRQTSRLSVEVNFSGDLGGELDSANQSTHMRQLLHIPSISPSAASLNRPVFQQNSVFHTPRASLAAVGQGQTSPNTFMGTSMASPSSFAPTGHQSLSVSLLPAPLPGHHYMASSPSPAASGGASSGFRDPRQTGS